MNLAEEVLNYIKIKGFYLFVSSGRIITDFEIDSEDLKLGLINKIKKISNIHEQILINSPISVTRLD